MPFEYQPIAQSTWAYLSSLLMLALFFKFNRFWSVRNFDLILIILLAPGILLVDYGQQMAQGTSGPQSLPAQVTSGSESDSSEDASADVPAENPQYTAASGYQRSGFLWLFVIGAFLMARLLLDPMLIRRPLLAPNLTIGGLVFLACSLLTVLFANVIAARVTEDDISGARSAVKMLQREVAEEDETQQLQKCGPGYPLFSLFPVIPMFDNGQQLLETDADRPQNQSRYQAAAKSLAILGQLALVIGLVLVGLIHFNNFRVGVGMATIYLMLPYTAIFTGAVLHVLPAALLVWAIVCFRRPALAGMFIGLATGVAYYPIFLLPLWISFYWEKGVRRFVSGVVLALLICIAGLILTSADLEQFWIQLQATFGFWLPRMEGLEGIWGLGWNRWYRVPILVAFVLLCISFVFWPLRKDLGMLISFTCVIMVGVQFWHGYGGGLFMAWYMPTALMTIFRPIMEGRVASVELKDLRPAKSSSAEQDLLPAA